jgi:hypothetical protein
MRHDRHLRLPRAVVAFASLGALALTPGVAQADVGGVGFWLPGSMGSLSAVPGQAGWSFTSVYLHLEANAGGGKELQNNASIVTGLHARADALGFLPAYTFETPVLGGQLTVGAAGVPGNVGLNIGAALTGPGGNQVSGNARDERSTFADVYYLATLKWNQGVNNYMWFVLGNIPSGTYDPTRLANLSPGYTAVDSGVGYTYLDPHTGHELSAVAGFTYNGMNEALQYRNGIDFHFDWAVSQFVSKSVLVGIAGYVYQQVTGDSGAGAKLGDFKGRSVGIGPQIGFFFPAFEGYTGYLNIRGYWDVATENRPTTQVAMVTLSFAPSAPSAPEKPTMPRGPRH